MTDNPIHIQPLSDLLDTVKDIEGFPIGKDEDILALSDPPHYTACPNPYMDQFITSHGTPYDEATDTYHRNPFVGDVSEGKNDPVYNAHSYHTKVPCKAIIKYIEHYTDKGDLVFDGFCGTGMTGVAAQMLNRKAVLSDLSPIATFIACNYNTRIDAEQFRQEAEQILAEVEAECGWMYETTPDEDAFKVFRQNAKDTSVLPDKGTINYTVWSDVFVCPYCHAEHVFWEQAVDKENGKIRKNYHCPECSADIQKTDCTRATVSYVDNAVRETVVQARQVPVLINYTWGKKRFEKIPDDEDLAFIKKIENSDIPYWFPTNKIYKGDKTGEPRRIGITHVHHFYTKRNLWVLASLYKKYRQNELIFLLLFESIAGQLSNKLSRFNMGHRGNGPVSGTLYVASMTAETNIFRVSRNKLNNFISAFSSLDWNEAVVNTSSIENIQINNNSIDYIFTDPPFGDNLMYSELNFLWESRLKVFTNNHKEAIINKSQNKGLSEYADLMTRSFKECFRILKPNRWITVVFHNSKSHIWNAIQDSLNKAGFIISNVAVLNKKQGSFNQVTTSMAVSKDLVISAYKPKQGFTQRFLENAGHDLEKEFIAMHLSHLDPEPSIERTEQMLYSRMLSYYVQRGYAIRHNASTFFQMLNDAFVSEDGYWFMPDQVSGYQEYKKKMKLEGISDIATGNLVLFVTDEKSALIWLNAFLETPRTYSDISTAFNKVATTLTDAKPELTALLEENFVHDNGLYRRPSSNKEKIPLSEKRQRALIREFDALLLEASTSRKKIKSCRKEALAAGFEHCYKQEKYQDILTLARKLDKKLLENNADLNEFIEVAEIKVEGV
ncbi:MAG: DNA methyltransferase [Thermodesulfobacteriota bacterium]|nr:DNA methyltransferase [Thermodesulfobacteriota bacterium]